MCQPERKPKFTLHIALGTEMTICNKVKVFSNLKCESPMMNSLKSTSPLPSSSNISITLLRSPGIKIKVTKKKPDERVLLQLWQAHEFLGGETAWPVQVLFVGIVLRIFFLWFGINHIQIFFYQFLKSLAQSLDLLCIKGNTINRQASLVAHIAFADNSEKTEYEQIGKAEKSCLKTKHCQAIETVSELVWQDRGWAADSGRGR